jgi:hypothetical protein
MWTIILLSACANQDATPDPAAPVAASEKPEQQTAPETDGADEDAAQAGLDLDPWETELVTAIIDDVRGGIQLYDKNGFGLCIPGENNKCGLFIGSEHQTLPHGDYFVRAEVQAPASGTDWKVEYEYACTVHHRDGKVSENPPKTTIRPVKYKASRPYPVRLPKVKSPAKLGRHECIIKLHSLRPDGQKTLIAEGSYTIPVQGGEAPDRETYLSAFETSESEQAGEPSPNPDQ